MTESEGVFLWPNEVNPGDTLHISAEIIDDNSGVLTACGSTDNYQTFRTAPFRATLDCVIENDLNSDLLLISLRGDDGRSSDFTIRVRLGRRFGPIVDFIDTQGKTGEVSLRFTVSDREGPVNLNSIKIEQGFNFQTTGDKLITEYISNQDLAPFDITQLEQGLFEVTFTVKWPGRFILHVTATDEDGNRTISRSPVEVYWSEQPFQVRGVEFGAIVWPHDHADLTTDDFEMVFDQLQALNINFIELDPAWHTADINAGHFARAPSTRNGLPPYTSITDDQIRELVKMAHARSMGVMIKLTLFHTDRPNTVAWQNPDDPVTWIRNYGNEMLLPMSKLAAEENVEMLSLLGDQGPEINKQREEWLKLINQIKQFYSGVILSADLDFPDRFTYRQGEFSYLDALDVFGFQPFLSGSGNPEDSPRAQPGVTDPTVEEMAEYIAINFDLREEEVTDQGLRGILTEFGSHNNELANWWPVGIDFAIEQGSKGAIDNQEQVEYYEASFRVFADRGWIDGMFLWNMGLSPALLLKGNGITNDVRAKPIADMIRIWFHTDTIEPAGLPQPAPNSPPSLISLRVNGVSLTAKDGVVLLPLEVEPGDTLQIEADILDESTGVLDACSKIVPYAHLGQNIYRTTFNCQIGNELAPHDIEISLRGNDGRSSDVTLRVRR